VLGEQLDEGVEDLGPSLGDGRSARTGAGGHQGRP
jgi:hypothetical protein